MCTARDIPTRVRLYTFISRGLNGPRRVTYIMMYETATVYSMNENVQTSQSEDSSLLGCNITQIGINKLPTFWNYLLPLSF
jgi:hypothetical protein